MANPNFPGPNINRIIEEDPQIVKVNLEATEWGGRKSAQPSDIKNKMSLEHVASMAKGN